jgi:hypothetical protein
MGRLPDALFVVDTRKEQIAVDEARKLKIPVIGVVDTNCDPDQVDFVIPGNDDALRSIRLFASRVADAVIDGRGERESQLAEQAQVDAEAAAADEANRTVRPANLRKPPSRPSHRHSRRRSSVAPAAESSGRREPCTGPGARVGQTSPHSPTHFGDAGGREPVFRSQVNGNYGRHGEAAARQDWRRHDGLQVRPHRGER